MPDSQNSVTSFYPTPAQDESPSPSTTSPSHDFFLKAALSSLPALYTLHGPPSLSSSILLISYLSISDL